MDTETKKIFELGVKFLQKEMEIRFPNYCKKSSISVLQNPRFWVIPENLKAMDRLEFSWSKIQ